MNYSDLFVVLALASGLYGVIVALARQRAFLTRAVNPYRWQWLFAGLTALWCGIGLLRLEARSWSPEAWSGTLSALVTDAPLSTQGKVASVALLLGLLFLILVIWCRFNFPRDPLTFRRVGERCKALRYYVSRLKGGLDYAVLMRPGGERLEEAWYEKHILQTLSQMPRICGPNNERVLRTVNDQLAFWRSAAEKMHASIAQLDEVIAPAHQGANRRIIFDSEYGGLYFAYLRPPVNNGGDGEALFVFGATLSQEAMNSKEADLHFDLLMKALKEIDTNVRIA